MRQSALRVRESAHYRLTSSELAEWLDSQGFESWWSVDGDPLLMGRLNFPCPSAELAKLLRSIDKCLLFLDPRPTSAAHGETVTAETLDEVASVDQTGNGRVFQVCWEDDADSDWLLCEDLESGRLADRSVTGQP